jgi:phosphatidylserine/phosphatidylglycerophosphate/cardiolipin synthase-like enzyme
MTGSAAARLDRFAGRAIEAAVATKHRRRLARLGWSRVYDPPGEGVFAAGEPPPRAGCSLELLIDGAEALPEIGSAIAGARRFVHLSGWHLEPGFELCGGDPRSAVGAVLAEAARTADVRVLVWSGAPVPVFHPTRSEVSRTLRTLTHDTRIQAHADPREHPFHCHHEKTVVIDGELAFVGGIDLTDRGGDRWDVPRHPARRRTSWHDVATRLRGPAVADVDAHFRLRWRELTGEDLGAPEPPEPPEPAAAGGSTVQVVRTIEEDMYERVPHGDFRILESYLRALHSARRLIYIENQFLWATEVVDVLADKLRDPPTPEFRVVIMLPAKANNGAEDTRGQVGVLLDADAGRGRFLAATIRATSPDGGRTDPLYVHAKLAVIDDRWLIVGSANLNAHSLYNDTELCVVTDDAQLAREARVRLWSEHLELERPEVESAGPAALVDQRWRPIAAEQLRRAEAGRPATHRLIELPGASRRSARLLGPLSGLVADG